MNNENGGVVCRVGSHDWRISRLAGRQFVAVEGEHTEGDVVVDPNTHSISVIDRGDTDQLLQDVARGIEEAHDIEDAEPVSVAGEPGFSDDIEPMGLVGDESAPLLPNDPTTDDQE